MSRALTKCTTKNPSGKYKAILRLGLSRVEFLLMAFFLIGLSIGRIGLFRSLFQGSSIPSRDAQFRASSCGSRVLARVESRLVASSSTLRERGGNLREVCRRSLRGT